MDQRKILGKNAAANDLPKTLQVGIVKEVMFKYKEL